MSAVVSAASCCCDQQPPLDVCDAAWFNCGFQNYPRMRVSFAYQSEWIEYIFDSQGQSRVFCTGDFNISGSMFMRREAFGTYKRYVLDGPALQRVANIETRGFRQFEDGDFGQWDMSGQAVIGGALTCGDGTAVGGCTPPFTPPSPTYQLFLTNQGMSYPIEGMTRQTGANGQIVELPGFVSGFQFSMLATSRNSPACSGSRCPGIPLQPPDHFFGGCQSVPAVFGIGDIFVNGGGAAGMPQTVESDEIYFDRVAFLGASKIDPELGGFYYRNGQPFTVEPPSYCITYRTSSFVRELYHFVPPDTYQPSIFPFLTNGFKTYSMSLEALTY